MGNDALEVDVKLTDGKISGQEFLVNATKQAHEVADQRPHAFNGIDMDLTQAITIIIPRPFFESMRHGAMRTVHLVVTLPFIGIDVAAILREVFHMSAQGLTVSVFDHA